MGADRSVETAKTHLKMEFYNHIDEQNRFRELRIYDTGKDYQCDTHVASYLYARMRLQEMGEVMGLDKLLQEE